MKNSDTCAEAGFIAENLTAIRRRRPLIHCMTNQVTMNLVANTVLAVGASPIMALAVEEVSEITSRAEALLINTGTISSAAVEAMRISVKKASAGGIPVVVDPVGAAASAYRRRLVNELLNISAPVVIRANASEVLALAGSHCGRGVDSFHESDQALDAARELAAGFECTVIVSGKTDYVISKDRRAAVTNGSSLMSRVTGMGCAASALAAVFATVCLDGFEAATGAMVATGIAGELAAARAHGPGSFQVAYLDSLNSLDGEKLENLAGVSVIRTCEGENHEQSL